MRRTGALALTAVLGLGLVACGSSSKTDASGDTTTTEAAASGDVSASAFAGNCSAFVSAFAGASTAVGSAFSGNSNASDLEKAAEYFKTVAAKLPKEIRADFLVFATAYSDFAKAMVDAKIDVKNPASMNPETMAKLEKLGQAFQDPKVQAASKRVQAYIDANCKGG